MQKIFGTAGIRGVFNKDLGYDLVLRLAFALSSYKERGVVSLARDGRFGAEAVKYELESGFISSGWNVYDVGVTITPVLAFSTRGTKSDYGVMVTASHNPPEYVGMKVFSSEGMELTEEREKKIQEKISALPSVNIRWSDIGEVKNVEEMKERYIDEILKRRGVRGRGLKVVVDCANGPTAPIISGILSSLGHKNVLINDHLDGRFPGRPPEPTPRNLGKLANYVKSLKFDLGLAFDGDGDRLAIIDERGKFVSLHTVSAIYIKKKMEETSNKRAVISIDCSNAIREVVEAEGGKVFISKLGKVFEGVKRFDAAVGTEPWKIIDRDWGLWEDGIYAAVRIVQWISEQKLTASKFFKQVPEYPNVRLSVPVKTRKDGVKIIEKIGRKWEKEAVKTTSIDGLRFELDERTWILVRVSGTENKIRIYAEADTKRKLSKVLKETLEAGGLRE